MRSRLTLVTALALSIALWLPAVALAQRPAKRIPPQKWKAKLSQPKYRGVKSSIHYLKADDGAQLSLTLHLPEGLEKSKRIPTLLQITPYQPLTLNPRPTGPPSADSDWTDFVVRGAAYVEADARGTNASDGCLDFGGKLDRADAKTFTKWIKKQRWSNGRVVSDGISHPGMGSVVAHAAIPDLTAALAHAPVVSYYQDEWLQGAKFEDQLNGPLYDAFEHLPPNYVSPESLKAQAATCSGQTTLDYSPVDGPFTKKWAERDLSRHIPDQRTPILLTHGFADLNVHPDHSQMYWDALPNDYPKYAIFGWWYHGWPDMSAHPFFDFKSVRHRWLDATLFNKDNGLWREPRVLVQDSLGKWHEGRQWPLEPSKKVTLFPSKNGSLAGTAGSAGRVSFTDQLGAERGTWEGAKAVFKTGPLKEDRLINGAPDVHLKASSSESATKWVAYLLDVAPDGSWQRISHGYADSHSWGPANEWRAMEPHKPYRWKLDLMPTATVVAKGHRLALLITSQDSRRDPDYNYCFSDYQGGCYNPSGILPATTVGRAVNSINVGPKSTSVSLHWVDPDKTQKVPWHR